MKPKKTTPPVIELQKVTFEYSNRPVLENINLRVEARDFLMVIGPNGAGKSTLIKLLLGLISPQKGHLKVLGKSPKQSRHQIGYLPQGNFFDLKFPFSAEEVVLYGGVSPKSFSPFFTAVEKQKARDVLSLMGVYDYRKEKIGHLSGGLRQRVFIARALVSDPKILILDEPGTHLDSTTEKELYELLHLLNKTMTIIMVSHDISSVSKMANKVACVNQKLLIRETQEFLKSHDPHKPSSDFVPIHHTCQL